MLRLNHGRLDGMSTDIKRPAYDRSSVRPGIIHIGIGAFHRGHMAVYIDDLLEKDPRWGIIGASLRRPDTKQALAPQDYLYSVNVKDGSGIDSRIVGSVLDIIDASQGSERLIAALSQAHIHIVSLTVTEKGYCHNPATGRLSTQHADIIHDAIHPENPRSVPGIIVAAAERRRALGCQGLTVLSCDNLQGNGAIARSTTLEFARLRDSSLADWIEANFTFPATMVDRIVPSLGDQDKADIAAHLGLEDDWPVITEPFSQWVIENNFAGACPDLQSVGAQMVSDVEPFELMKLRMLNGSHSAMAYLGQLCGHTFVSEAVNDSAIRALLIALMTDEVIPTLEVEGLDLAAYRDALLKRFANPALKHQLAQIATDGSQKLPQRVLAPIRERIEQGQSIELLCLTLAGWIAYLESFRDDEAQPADALGSVLAEAIGQETDPEETVQRVFAIQEIFGNDLVDNKLVNQSVARHLNAIRTEGARAAISQALARAQD